MLLALVAPSGAGKTTLKNLFLEKFSYFKFSISYITRSARLAERNGLDYHFISIEEFCKKDKEGFFIETACINGHYYGTSREILDWDAQGKDILFDIDVQGVKNIKKKFPSLVTVFIQPPSLEELGRRLRKRGMNTEVEVQQRLKRAEIELTEAKKFKYVIINDIIDVAFKSLCLIVEKENRTET